ncbi:hypothetical protein NSP_21770 [Nodularia spumigena CCY9414]|nr:hypothetical protein NSP_21770 [Nodularia spumigena CCY9414]
MIFDSLRGVAILTGVGGPWGVTSTALSNRGSGPWETAF